MQKWVKKVCLCFVLLLMCGCQTTQTTEHPVQSVSSLASKKNKQNPVLAVPGQMVLYSGKAFVWVIKELFFPFNVLRKGLINKFGVTEETFVKEKNLPPSPYRN